MTTIYKKWIERIEAPTIRHHHVMQLYATVYPLSQGWPPGGKHTALEGDEALDIIERLDARVDVDGGIRAEPENEERGRQWLARNARKMGLPDMPSAEITEFRLVGFHVYTTSPYGYWMSAAPIWRCHWAHGSQLDYAPTAWQATMATAKRRFWWDWHADNREMMSA